MNPVSVQANQLFLALSLTATLILVFWVSTKTKVQTIQQYALIARSVGTGVMVMALLSALLGGYNTGLIRAYDSGLFSFLNPLCFALVTMFLGWFIFPKLKAFKNCYTVSDVMGVLYGNLGYQVTLWIGTLFCVLMVISQLMALGGLSRLIGLPPMPVVLGMGVLVTLYGCWAGARPLTVTEVLQFMFVCGGFITITLVVLGDTWYKPLLLPPDAHHASLISHLRMPRKLVALIFWGLCPTLLVSPPVVQRVLMAEGRAQVRYMLVSFAGFYMALRVLVLVLGLKLFAIFPGQSKSMNLSLIIEHITEHQLAKTLFFLTLFFIILSTADTFLNSLSLLLAHDFSKRKQQPTYMIAYSQVVALLAGLGCTAGALVCLKYQISENDMVPLACVFLSVLVVPFIAGVCGLQGSKKAFIATLSTFFASFFLGLPVLLYYSQAVLRMLKHTTVTSWYMPLIHLAWLGSMVLSTVVFFATHYLENGRWVVMQLRESQWPIIRGYNLDFSWFRTPVKWANEKVALYGKEPNLFSMFMGICILMPLPLVLTINPDIAWLTLRMWVTGCMLCGFLLLENLWPNHLLPFFNLFYFLTIFYCVPLMNTLLVMHGSYNAIAVIRSSIGILLLLNLLDFHTFLLQQFLAIMLVLLINKLRLGLWLGTFPTTGLIHKPFLLVPLAYTLLIALIFSKKKQGFTIAHRRKLQAETNQQTAYIDDYLSLHQQLANTFHRKSSMMRVLEEATRLLKLEAPGSVQIARIESAARHFQQVANKSYEYLPIVPQAVAMADLLEGVFQSLQAYGLEPYDRVTLKQAKGISYVICDAAYIQELITNGVRYLAERYPQEQITCSIELVPFDYKLPEGSKDKVREALRLVITSDDPVPPAQEHYTLEYQSDLVVPSNHLLMARNQQIIRAHYGLASFETTDLGCVQEYILPVNVQELRPKIQRFSEEDLLGETTLGDDYDKAFIQLLRNKGGLTNLDIEEIKHAMKVAKYYHRNDMRKSGVPYYLHPLTVASILLDYTNDKHTLIAALLHDTIEDTPYTYDQMAAMFGNDVVKLVNVLSKLHSTRARKVKLSNADSSLILLQTEDKRALLIKLADRLHNLRTIGAQPPEKRKAKALETQEIFLVLAREMKLEPLERELQEHIDKILNEGAGHPRPAPPDTPTDCTTK